MNEKEIILNNHLIELEKSISNIEIKYLNESETYRSLLNKKSKLENSYKIFYSNIFCFKNSKNANTDNNIVTILTRESETLQEEYKDHSFYSYGKELKALKSTVLNFPYYNELKLELDKRDSENNLNVVFFFTTNNIFISTS